MLGTLTKNYGFFPYPAELCIQRKKREKLGNLTQTYVVFTFFCEKVRSEKRGKLENHTENLWFLYFLSK